MNTYEYLLANSKNKVIIFLDGIKEYEDYPEPGMKAIIKEVFHLGEIENIWKIVVDYEPFESHNIKLECSDYYDSTGKPCAGAKEAGMYESRSYIYSEPDIDINKRYIIV